MAADTTSPKFGFDRYDRNARLYPALIVMLPALVSVAVWVPDLWHELAGLLPILIACGALYLISRYARFAGRRLEKRMVARLGWPSTRLLRHRDEILSPRTTERYHAALRGKGFEMPTQLEEQADPRRADDCYADAATWLVGQTRSDEMLKNENISYGFWRNLVGLRFAGGMIAATSFVVDAGLALSRWPDRGTQTLAIAAVAAMSLIMLLPWIFRFNERIVQDAGEAYALRLLKHCETL
ncbi:hypothetical protein HZF05_16325 [Sphingomonas sp. CGMCC 1.13654]|uniref:Uncharacterized protein n=1 Tax=Sphingomonas chungangi TaxID=2683589 RepID=A0A838L8M2_9SPHN|nr:hypothetical protein [Sphingomonas chungangi]MBA2935651.1 hypothetical protein [Sphingomonas chungangi]MVW54342.1 hypothetical protein [Sphingomonas chungangi]